MAVIPKRTKYRRPHRLHYDGVTRGNKELHFCEYGLQACEGAWITQQQIEAARVAMTRYMKRGGKIKSNVLYLLQVCRVCMRPQTLHNKCPFLFPFFLKTCRLA